MTEEKKQNFRNLSGIIKKNSTIKEMLLTIVFLLFNFFLIQKYLYRFSETNPNAAIAFQNILIYTACKTVNTISFSFKVYIN